MEKSISDKIKFVEAERLCFGVALSLAITQRFARAAVSVMCATRGIQLAYMRSELKKIKNKNSTSLVQVKKGTKKRPPLKQPNEITTVVTSNKVIFDETNTQTAAIIPVWISSITQPAQEVLV